MRVLFATQVGSGHWRPLAPLAQALATAGHEVAFATTPVGCSDVGRHGFRCFPAGIDDWLKPARQEQQGWSQPPEPEQSASVTVNIFVPAAERRLPELLAVCRAWRPDVIVREQTEFAACVAAERLGLPHATVQISFFRPHLDGLLAAPLDRLRALAGLPPDPDRAMLYRYLLLLPFPPRYRDPAAALPPTAHFIRHVGYDVDRPCDARPPDWIEHLLARPVVGRSEGAGVGAIGAGAAPWPRCGGLGGRRTFRTFG